MPGTHAEMIARLRAERARLVERIAQVDAAIAALAPLAEVESLQDQPVSDNVHNVQHGMDMRQRLKISRAVQGIPETENLRAAIRAKGDTMQSASEKIEADLRAKHGDKYRVSQALLSMAAIGKRPIYQPVADAIEKRYGHKASKKNWPDLRLPPTE